MFRFCVVCAFVSIILVKLKKFVVKTFFKTKMDGISVSIDYPLNFYLFGIMAKDQLATKLQYVVLNSVVFMMHSISGITRGL